jgi:anhydro-N-acetylmuramic acid kinase
MASLFRTNGLEVRAQGASIFLPYSPALYRKLLAARDVSIEQKAVLDREISDWFIQTYRLIVEKSDKIPDVIGFYGKPLNANTEKVGAYFGSADYISSKLQLPIVYDFHQTDLDAGGNGRFLEGPYYSAVVDRAINQCAITRTPIAILDASYTARVTIIASDCDPITLDAGPGLAFVDEFTQYAYQTIDLDGTIASRGDICGDMLLRWERRHKEPPAPASVCDMRKFAPYLRESVATTQLVTTQLDTVVTLVAFVSYMIERAITSFHGTKIAVLTGRGFQNSCFKTLLSRSLKIVSANDMLWNSRFELSEQAAFNAVRRLNGLPISYPTTTGVSLVCGKYIYPDQVHNGHKCGLR